MSNIDKFFERLQDSVQLVSRANIDKEIQKASILTQQLSHVQVEQKNNTEFEEYVVKVLQEMLIHNKLLWQSIYTQKAITDILLSTMALNDQGSVEALQASLTQIKNPFPVHDVKHDCFNEAVNRLHDFVQQVKTTPNETNL